jgi:histidinol-phosphatase
LVVRLKYTLRMSSPRLKFAVEAALEAGDATLSLFQQQIEVHHKEDESPVTEADLLAERLIRKRLKSSFPEDGILGEEEGESGSIDSRWLIDPIDGTKSFVSGVPLYATLLSYEVEGVPQIGVAYFPALKWLVYAEKGQGAFVDGKPIHVSQKASLERAMIAHAAITGMEKRGWLKGAQELGKQCMGLRTWCDAYGHCLVAAGRVEAMIDPKVQPHDLSAVSLIVQEAGGTCTDVSGELWPRTEAISTNGLLHSKILETLRA